MLWLAWYSGCFVATAIFAAMRYAHKNISLFDIIEVILTALVWPITWVIFFFRLFFFAIGFTCGWLFSQAKESFRSGKRYYETGEI